ncbi:TonB-dependent receptor plug domain-containing protein [Acanthopleuribacter pedis]|uniref:TonB-dependent receptor n=1 Tax=Acanthopleuribacter pedis TaxID=442870 RepID=A0A8J7Q4N6_9BACT|nr:TonB-dependent receptor [Acanthopleuribacter pedis]MBO1317731.1 TonB-dependent receptor [Acanthopleuribacter pedis]
MFRPRLFALGFALTCSLFAQNYDKMTIEDILQTEVTMLFKSKSTPLKAPGIISIISRSEIERSGMRTLSEILNLSIGIEANRAIMFGRHTTIGMRGRTTHFGEDILILLDGQRLNDVYSGGGLSYIKDMSLRHVDRIEIIRGPGSTLFGSNAYVGVINIISSTYSTTDKQSISLATGSFDTVDIGTQYRWNSGKLHTLFTANAYSDDGDEFTYTEGYLRTPGIEHRVTDPVEEQIDLGLKVSYEDFSLHMDWFKREMDDYMPFGFFENPTDWEPFDTNRDDSEMFRLQAGYDWEVNRYLTITGNARYSEAEANMAYVIAPENLFIGTVAQDIPWLGGSNYSSDNLEFEMRVNYVRGKHEVIGGAMWAREGIEEANLMYNYTLAQVFSPEPINPTDWTVVEGEGSFVSPRSRNISGVYLQDTYYPSEHWGITAGIRYDKFADFGDAINPRLAGVYNVGDTWVFKLLYGKAFRAPTYNELYTRNLPIMRGTPDLDAQTIETYETSAHFSPGPVLATTLSLFYSTYEGTIQQEFALYTDEPYFNGEDGDRDQGLELDLKWRLVRGSDLRLGYTYVSSENADGSRRLFTPEHKGTLSFYQRIGRGGLFSLTGFHHGTRLVQAPESVEKMDNATVFHARYRQRHLIENVDVELSVYNLTDEEWYSPGLSAILAPQNVLNRGVSYQLKAGYRF